MLYNIWHSLGVIVKKFLLFISGLFKIISIIFIISFININSYINIFKLSSSDILKVKLLLMIACLILILISLCFKSEAYNIEN